MSILAKVCCTPEAIDYMEIIYSCPKHFDAKHMLIQVKETGKNPIPLTPLTHIRMLRLPNPAMNFNST